ncbi:MAG: metal-dependent transcriptional regulator [Erysipelotrichaceae bacterium]|jgi:DtxR family Mn-dependent transcriptional regulator|nr:metal-dependent transcriptional regulator [Erysipelotrichaceae bacterium]
MAMPIYESAEDYLETILMIEERKGTVHSVDVAEDRHFSKASVSVAMKKLRENGYIKMEKDGSLKLLPPGRKIAERIYERHRVLTDYFVKIGVDPDTAQKDACKVEHDLSDITFQKIKEDISKR